MKIDRDTITFSSGRTLYANCGVIGLSPDLTVSEGWDGGINWPHDPDPENRLTAEDMSELADYMIEQWTKFKATLHAQPR